MEIHLTMAARLSLKDKLHQYIDTAEEKKLRAIYTLIEDEINGGHSTENIKLLHQRRQHHLNGTSKSYTAEESLKVVRRQKK